MASSKSSGAGSENPPPTSPPKKQNTKKNKVQQGKQISDAVKAEIIAALLSTQFETDEAIALHIGCSPGTVSKYKKLIPAEYFEELLDKRTVQIAEMVFTFLESGFSSLKAIDDYVKSDEGKAWIDRQDAAELATFYGVKTDKLLKVLDAINEASKAPEQEPISAVEEHSA